MQTSCISELYEKPLLPYLLRLRTEAVKIICMAHFRNNTVQIALHHKSITRCQKAKRIMNIALLDPQ